MSCYYEMQGEFQCISIIRIVENNFCTLAYVYFFKINKCTHDHACIIN